MRSEDRVEVIRLCKVTKLYQPENKKLTMAFSPGPEAQQAKQMITMFLKDLEGVQLEVRKAPHVHRESLLSDWSLEMAK